MKKIILTLITVGVTFLIEPAIAGVGNSKRQITAIEWGRSGNVINCNGRGTEYFVDGGNAFSMFRRVTIVCQNLHDSRKAQWVVLGGISARVDGAKKVTLEASYPYTEGRGQKPNIYSFVKFVAGRDCILNKNVWRCQKYSKSILNNNLKTYGVKLQQLSENDYSFFSFAGIDEEQYITINY